MPLQSCAMKYRKSLYRRYLFSIYSKKTYQVHYPKFKKLKPLGKNQRMKSRIVPNVPCCQNRKSTATTSALRVILQRTILVFSLRCPPVFCFPLCTSDLSPFSLENMEYKVENIERLHKSCRRHI